MQSFGITLTNRYLVQYGTDNMVASMGIAMKVNMIVVLIMVGFAFGAQPLLGYNYGAKNTKRLKEILRFDLMVEIGFSVVVAAILALLAPQTVNLFMHDANHRIRQPDVALHADLDTIDWCGACIYDTISGRGKAVPALLLSVSRQGVLFAIC